MEQWEKKYENYGRSDKASKFKEKVSFFMKKFIPPEVRSRVWPALLDNRLGITPTLYQKLLERRKNGEVEEKMQSQIAKDIKRSFYGKTNYNSDQQTVDDAI